MRLRIWNWGCAAIAVLLAAAPADAWDHFQWDRFHWDHFHCDLFHCHQPTVRVEGAPPAQPPWLDERPYRVAPPGIWAPREADWRTVDWSGKGCGNDLHRHTQAHSLWFERKWVTPAKPSRQPYHNIGIHEFVPSAPVCGPGIR